jgi:predicted nucleic acid-binding protein
VSHLLDTSALLAHYFGEPGADQVQALLDDHHSPVGISALSLYEADRRLVILGADPTTRKSFAECYAALLDFTAPVDEKVAATACFLREKAIERVAAVDILIAATAKIRDATFVHRDAHFAAIPPEHLRQLALTE